MIDISLLPHHLLIGAIGFILMLFVLIVFPARKNHAQPYERMTSILTPSEQRFYKVLFSVLEGQTIIMSKVRIADLLKVQKSIRQKHFWSYFSKISQKHVDFVLIDPQTFTTLCVIELDDKSHLKFDRMKRDRFVNQIMTQTGIPLYRFGVKRRYDRAEILQKLSTCLILTG